MDVVTQNGNWYIIGYVDYLTKWVETSNHNAEMIARLFVENIVCRHGVPGRTFVR